MWKYTSSILIFIALSNIGHCWRRALRNSQHIKRETMKNLILQNAHHHDSSSDDIVYAGFILEELGLTISVRDSLFKEGKGLFIALSDPDVDEVRIPQGQILCGYAKGTFNTESVGDKTVGYVFNQISNLIIYNKVLTSLSEVVRSHLLLDPHTNFTNFIMGHNVITNDSNDFSSISPTPFFKQRYFVPTVPREGDCISISNLGMFANDMAYDIESSTYLSLGSDSETEASANIDSGSKTSCDDLGKSHSSSQIDDNSGNGIIVFDDDNIYYPINSLQLVWRMELQNQVFNRTDLNLVDSVIQTQLVPTWPVVIFGQDVIFRNHNPIEIGLEYSVDYWEAFGRSLLKPDQSS